MSFKKAPPSLDLGFAIGEWLTVEEITAVACDLGVTLAYESTSAAAFELISYVWQDEQKMAELEAATWLIIMEREAAAHDA